MNPKLHSLFSRRSLRAYSDRVARLIRLFHLPDEVVPMAAIASGRPAETPAPRTRYSNERVHRGSW